MFRLMKEMIKLMMLTHKVIIETIIVKDTNIEFLTSITSEHNIRKSNHLTQFYIFGSKAHDSRHTETLS